MKKHVDNLKVKMYLLLRWSERFFKTDMVYLSKGGFWAALTFAISASLSFGLTLLFANFLTKDAYGIYKYIFSIYGLLGAVTLSGLDIVIVQAVSKGEDGILRKAVRYSLKWNVILFLSAIGVSIYYYLNSNNQLASAFAFIAVLAPILNSFNLYGSFLNGKKDFRLISISNAASNIFSAIVVLIFIIFTQSPLWIVFGYFVSNTVATLFFYFVTIKKYNPGDQANEDYLKRGKHLSFMGVLGIISESIDKILIFHFLGGLSLAVYAFAVAPVTQINALLKLSAPVITPKITERTKEENKKHLPKKILQMTLLLIIPTAGYILLAPYFYKLFFPQYTDAIVYSQFYALIILTFGKKFTSIPALVHLPQKTLYKISLINNSISILSKVVLLFLFGLAGAIAAGVVTNFLLFAISYYYFKKM